MGFDLKSEFSLTDEDGSSTNKILLDYEFFKFDVGIFYFAVFDEFLVVLAFR